MESVVTNPSSSLFEAVLRRNREALNAMFLQHAALMPHVDGDATLLYLSDLSVAFGDLLPSGKEPQDACVSALLWFSMKIASTRQPLPAHLWAQLVSSIRTLAQRQLNLWTAFPQRFLRDSFHVLLAVAPQQFADLMASLPAVATLDESRRQGICAAWLCGLPQYRDVALQELASWEPQHVIALLRVRIPTLALHQEGVGHWIAAQQQDPFAGSEGELDILGKAGGFRGLGGVFVELPRVTTLRLDNKQLLMARADGHAWQIYSDRFGTALVARPTLVAALANTTIRRPAELAGTMSARVTSIAQQATIEAFTTDDSYWISIRRAAHHA